MDAITIDKLKDWIKKYVESAHANGVVIGMSGGKDSLVVAGLCAQALGKDKVYGVIMPNGKMKDIVDAVRTCELLGIPYTTININKAYKNIIDGVEKPLKKINKELSSITTINTAPRIRMTTLYALAGSLNYLVANTSNLSEASVGYTTKWGDNVGDFAPLANFTKTEVCEIGLAINLPKELVNKIPSDGLSGKSDEDKLGFTYEELDNFIRMGKKSKNFEIISKKYRNSQHKRDGAVKFEYNKENYFIRRFKC